MTLRPGLLLSLLLLLAACGERPASTSAPAASADSAAAHAATGIHWFQGDVDAAFAAAKAQNKPVFLYWGAEWCPPCHQLKATVFLRPDFIEKSKLFIPVYLDGDLEGAQKWGEQFKVTGYPTLVVLDAERREIMRIAGGMDLSLYANVLDQALGDLQPVGDILAQATRGEKLSVAQCRRLAYNGWVLDDIDDAELAPQAARLVAAVALCPPEQRVERARIELVAAYLASEGKSATLRDHIQRVSVVLDDSQLSAPNSDALTYLGESFFTAVRKEGANSAASFNERYARAMDAAAADQHFAEADRLFAVRRKLQAAKVLTGTIPEALVKEGNARLDAAIAGNHIPYVRSGIINAALPIYELLGRTAEGYTMLQGELPKSQTPYYYKADLASIAEDLGRKDEALSWSEQAYNESKGAATRFQWGNLYLGTLLRLAPTDTVRIEKVATQVLAELEGENRIYQRARTRLATLDEDLREWQTAAKPPRTPVLRALRARMQQNCARIPATEPARASCDAFLAGAA
jgi:thiol-disulfide isomerase/thioredoxin